MDKQGEKIKQLTSQDQKRLFKECARAGHCCGDVISSEVKRLSKKYIGKKVLDIGAGDGALINLIPGAIGLDLVPQHPRVIEGDIMKMPFEDNLFDTIFAVEVLEHLDDKTLTRGLKEISRVLKSKGYFIMTVPYKEDLRRGLVICPKCGTEFHKVGHVQSFDEKRLKTILEKNNFRIIALKVLPLGFIGYNHFLRYFWRLINKLVKFQSLNFFVVAQKLK